MKIAFVEDNFLLWQRGGSFKASGVSPMFMLTEWESTMDLYAAELQKLGHECVKYVPSLESGPVEEFRHALGHTVAKVPCSVGAYPLLARADWRVVAIPFTRRIGRESFLKGADLVHYQSYYSSFFLASTLLGRGIRRTAQYTGGSMPESYSFLRRRVGSYLLARALHGVRAVILDDADPESRGQSRFLTEVVKIPSDKVIFLPTLMVDPEVFRRREKSESRLGLGVDAQATAIMVVSAVMNEPPPGDELTKDPFRVVRLFSKIVQGSGPGIQLHVVGGGSGIPALKDLVGRLGLDKSVSFHGVVPHDQVALYMAAADLVCVPYRFLELNYGTSVLEAFACGRAVCGFRRDRSAPVDRVGGFLLDSDEESGAKELAARVRDASYLERKGAEGFEVAQSHLAGNVAKRLESAFESVLQGSR
jgi:glycosyltransferase involved in cell wall biosynthesis